MRKTGGIMATKKMKDNFGLMILLFGSFIIYFMLFSFITEFFIYLIPIFMMIFFWTAMPKGESRIWDSIRKHIFLIGVVWNL